MPAISVSPARRRTPIYAGDSRAGRPRKRAVRPARHPLRRRPCVAAAVLLLGAVGAGVASLWPTYVRGTPPNSSDVGLTLLHVVPLAAFLAAAIVLALRSGRDATAVAGGLVVGCLVVTSGLDVAALGQVVSEHLHAGLGFWLSLGSDGLALLAAVVVVGALLASRRDVRGRFRLHRRSAIVALGGAAAGVGYSFGWRRYRIVSSVLHTSTHRSIASVFDDKALVVVGAAVTLAGLSLVPVLASLWDRRRGGAAVAVGAVIGLGGYVALNVREEVGTASLGLAPSLVRRYGLHLTATFTGWFVLAAAGLVVLAVAGVVLLVRRDRLELS